MREMGGLADRAYLVSIEEQHPGENSQSSLAMRFSSRRERDWRIADLKNRLERSPEFRRSQRRRSGMAEAVQHG